MKKKIIILFSSIAMITLISLSLNAINDPCADLRQDMCIDSTLWCIFDGSMIVGAPIPESEPGEAIPPDAPGTFSCFLSRGFCPYQ